MNDQISKIASALVALITLALGYTLIHGTMQNPRPYTLEAPSHIPDPQDTHKVLSRLWQDPFEAFETGSNQPPAQITTAMYATNDDHVFWNDIAARAAVTNTPVAILGVMLEGGPYAEDKEVRLRVRYAVETALLTWEWGPEDRTHISTNTMWLTSGNADVFQRPSHYAYEWFETRSNLDVTKNTKKFNVCVLWLNEDDFADRPALRLGSLLTNLPSLTRSNGNTSFYLIGPRSTDTLRALVDTNINSPCANLTNFLLAAKTGRFQILSPEATASVHDSDADDVAGQDAKNDFKCRFGADIFHPWIASDQQVAGLISQELTNRISGAMRNDSNVVVLLSEQDTYYGSKLADEWITALVTNRVCLNSDYVWQFAYLRGLDGSKPHTDTQDDQLAAALADTPATTLGTVMQQQQKGEKADGDAQLDYIYRLTEFLEQKDREMKNRASGRIIAFGLTGSDAYDKLILLQELRRHFPEAVFFTSDLDASLWTAGGIKYTSSLLVGSAYPLEPNITDFSKTFLQDQFPPFRDVYQTAVFRATARAIFEHQTGEMNLLDAPPEFLRGALYKIGRHGPVELDPPAELPPDARWPYLIVALTALGALVLYFFASYKSGIQGLTSKLDDAHLKDFQKEVKKERARQISLRWLLVGMGIFAVAVILASLLQWRIWSIAHTLGEEPWSLSAGVSIWPSEYLRGVVCIGAGIFIVIAYWRRNRHREELWETFFHEKDDAGHTWANFFKDCKAEWDENLRRSLQSLQTKCRRLARAGHGSQAAAEAKPEVEPAPTLIRAWLPPFTKTSNEAEGCIDAAALFKKYLLLGRMRNRFKRICFSLSLYLVLAGSLIGFLHDVPTFLLIRGPHSHNFDKWMLVVAILAALFVLFYVLDAALLTKRLLDYISRHGTRWPDPSLQESSAQYGVNPGHLDGMLDVEFTAVQTGEIGPLMFGPIILLLILLFSRIPCFDGWTWPTGLVLIFIMNFMAAAICWWMVRRATENVRKDALERIDAAILSVKTSEVRMVEILAPGEVNTSKKVSVKKKVYLRNLKTLRQKIVNESRGAFARWFQDPTYLAVFVPSGVSGIISVICSVWLGK